MKLENLLDKKFIKLLRSRRKQEALEELIALVADSGKVRDVEKLRESIFYREKLMSTGIGLGIAVPHVRLEGVSEPVVAVGISREGIEDYESIDDSVVKFVFMIIVGKEQHKLYIRLLSDVVSRLRSEDVRRRLESASCVDEVYEILGGR